MSEHREGHLGRIGIGHGLSSGGYIATVAAGAAAAGMAIKHLSARLRSDPDDPPRLSVRPLGRLRDDYLDSPTLNLQPSAGHVTVNIDREILGADEHRHRAAVADVLARITAAVDEGQLSFAEAAAERALEFALQAIIGGDQPVLREIGSAIRKLRFKMVMDHKMSEAPTPERIVGMFSGLSTLVALAELAPPPVEARNVAEAILHALLRNQQLTTTELAKHCGYRQETVARTLTHLRKAGFVLSAKAGRNKQNSLTADGRRRALELSRREQDRDQPGRDVSSEPISLRRPSLNEHVDCVQVVKVTDLLAPTH